MSTAATLETTGEVSFLAIDVNEVDNVLGATEHPPSGNISSTSMLLCVKA